MFDGWFWEGSRADQRWDSVDGGITPRAFFVAGIEDACSGKSSDGCIVLHRDGALEAYLFHFGYKERSVHTALLMFAAAGDFKSEATVLFWAETGGNLLGEARFVSERDLTGTVAGLRPVESRFFDMVGWLGEEEESWDSDSGRDFPTDTPRVRCRADPPSDPAVLDPSSSPPR